MEDQERKAFESAWNLAHYIIIELSGLLQNASASYVSGNYLKAFNFLKAVEMRITADLNSTEKKSLFNLGIKIYENISNSKSKGFSYTHENALANTKTFLYYQEYNHLLMVCLKKYGYLIPPKKDKTKMN